MKTPMRKITHHSSALVSQLSGSVRLPTPLVASCWVRGEAVEKRTHPTPDQAGRLRVPPPRCVAPALLSMLGMRPTQIVVFAVALVAAPLLATAETSKQSGAHHAPKQLTKTDVAATPSAPGWDAAYAEARADMLAGRFAAAVQKFEALCSQRRIRQPPVGGRTPRRVPDLGAGRVRARHANPARTVKADGQSPHPG